MSSIQYFIPNTVLYEVFVLGQSVVRRVCLWCTVLYEVFVLGSISFKEGVSSIQYFIAIQCNMKSLFWRQSVVRRVWLVVYSSV